MKVASRLKTKTAVNTTNTSSVAEPSDEASNGTKQGQGYLGLADFLYGRFGERVFKVTLYAGFGCPNRDGRSVEKTTGGCVYCEPEALMPKNFNPAATITEQLNWGIARLRKRHKVRKFIAYFQINTNTYKDIKELRRLYKEALAHPEVVGLAISTRPDSVGEDVIELIAELKSEGKYIWLELGLQSSNDETLKRINRGHTARDFSLAHERARRAGIDVCAHIIFGLPGEDKESMLETVGFLRDEQVWGVKFHQMLVIRNTRLEAIYNDGGLKLLSLEEYARIVVESLKILSPETVIHRLSGEVPEQFLVAPQWGANKFVIKDRIKELIRGR
jgi:hypothetical protein